MSDANQPASTRMAPIAGLIAGCVLLVASVFTVQGEVKAANQRLKSGATAEAKPAVAIANDAEAAYCTPAFKTVLQRVIHACGLVGGESRRGCQPADVKTLASISDDDFNALFTPLRNRGAVIMFDDGVDTLDDGGKKVIEDLWVDRRGARYFFVVARASKSGTPEFNRSLSHKRANSVLFHLGDKFKDPEMDKQVGLLWLGNEFAQLGQDYCQWNVSRDKGGCSAEAINRSAFVSWVDCQL
jgi:outer membrane protein OmpA-like peptidoglycan-associated protein